MALMEEQEIARRRAVAELAARAAGEIHHRYEGTNIGFEVKGSDRRDLLTRADIEAQAAAKAIIEGAFPGERIVGEEDGLTREELPPYIDEACWLVDPLDGTQSYVHDFPYYAAGVAYVEKRRTIAGAVYVSMLDEMFSAGRGLGATLNGSPIHVVLPRPLKDALAGVHIREVGDAAVAQFLETTGRLLQGAHAVRLLGSPMISIAYVGAGRMGCFATLSPSKLMPWDLAPAVIVLEEAGGVCGDQDGAPFDMLSTGVSGAATRELLDELFVVARGKT
jgi:myo-inositol-1(or 4)-monophosphatase